MRISLLDLLTSRLLAKLTFQILSIKMTVLFVFQIFQ